MKILLTGANGYIGQRLIPVLLEQGHQVICCVRDKDRFNQQQNYPVEVLEVDFLQSEGATVFPKDVDVAYYLVHSMSTRGKFEEKETASAKRFVQLISNTDCKQIIYLTGIVNQEDLSRHLGSRLKVENILKEGPVPLTALRAGIIVGSGSASFEIIRDLVEKLPVMITPRWLNTRCQPIAIRDVIYFLCGVAGREDTYNANYDIAGPDVLTYRQMLLQYAEVRQLKRYILTLPVMTPRLSSYWLYFITSTSYPLAVNLVDSMKVDVTARPNDLAGKLGIQPVPYKNAVQLAFGKIEQNLVASSWKDSFSSANTPQTWMDNIEVPTYGCLKDEKSIPIRKDMDTAAVLGNVWRIGGNTGWYYANTLWRIRGFLDKIVGGVGLRRGRRHPEDIHAGDALDFWRVLVADKQQRRLLLFAEMRLPGEAWLEFQIVEEDQQPVLKQTATFRPRGLWGRLYWYAMLPFHYFIFGGMIRRLSNGIKDKGKKV
ncbi:SDR family oxidoreductase [Chitinophaga rhizophila]|uniref:SDR family oxidoreductase n=1 Tax=Chitinophaga rhizophila TaxID=2866212 RepID=A0ABS7G959_9BACT|nr:SDR family oxidoreductase [Chitinophaga rhizophila]MBW8684190.1 SDR family oxidoreductase [Chitinophaga rhizophila]